jgi:predicted nucleic acid-binding protein
VLVRKFLTAAVTTLCGRFPDRSAVDAPVESSAVRRIVMDANAIDPLADFPGAYEAMRPAVDQGQLEVLYTHITIDELSAVPDEDRRARLLLLLVDLGHLIPTGARVLSYSRLNYARFGNDSEALDAFRSGNIKHTRDALLAATAQYEQCELVTADNRLLRRAQERGVKAITPKQLLAELGFNIPG